MLVILQFMAMQFIMFSEKKMHKNQKRLLLKLHLKQNNQQKKIKKIKA